MPSVGLLLGCSAPSELLVILLSANTNDSRWGESTVLCIYLTVLQYGALRGILLCYISQILYIKQTFCINEPYEFIKTSGFTQTEFNCLFAESYLC